MREITQYLSFVTDILLSKVSAKFIHVIAYDKISFLYKAV